MAARRATLFLAVAVLAAAVVFLTWNRRGQHPVVSDSERLSVLLITIDTLRADRIGKGFTPNIDALAARGRSFTHARTTVPLTLPAHVSLMTGTIPPQHGIRENGIAFTPGPRTLAQRLKERGYATGAFVAAYVLNRRFGLADGFDTYDDRVDRTRDEGVRLEAERRAPQVAEAAIGWLEKAPAPFFGWVHFYDPHVPYDPPPDYVARGGGDPYNGEVAYADDHVGRVLDVLKARGLDSSTIVILAGDHGEGLGEHGEGTHGMLAYDATLRVPLAIVDPTDDAPRGAVATPVSLASVAPSLLARLRIDGNAARGADLFARQIADRDVYAETMYPRAAGWHPLTVLAGEQWKLILSSERELFDTRADPAEQRNVIAANERVADGMAGKLREIDAQAKTSGAAVSPDTAERLRALGYVSGSTRPSTSSDPNPARVIAAWSTFESALAKVNDARPEEALPALKDLAERYPASSIFLGSYARALKDAGRAREAIAVYRTAIERNPADATLFHDLAIAARAAGDSAEALKAQQAALALNANDPAALNGLGLLHAEAGRAQDAASAFERAVAADPGNASFVTNLANARRELGDQRGAEELYRRALTLDHQHLDAMNGLGVLLVQTRRMEEALPLFGRALQMDPEFHEARLNLGIAYQELGRRDAAIKTYSELLERAPASAARERAAAADLLRRLK